MILQTAQMLAQTRSYSGFSFEDIAERVGIRKASIYHHFPSKDLLIVEMLQRSRKLLADHAGKCKGGAAKRLSGYLAMIGDILDAGTCLCPGGAMASNWEQLSDSVKRSVEALRDAHLGILKGIFEDARKEGVIAASAGSANELAHGTFAVVQGGLALARISGKKKDYLRATAFALKIIKRW